MKLKERLENFRKETKEKFDKVNLVVSTWVKENPEQAAGLVCTVLFVGGGNAIGAIAKLKKEHDEYMDRECRQYDPCSGMYYETRRPLKNDEKLELEDRMANGERKGEILRSMGVL